ncbi:MAG: ATP-binding protein [Desulfoplanes sp.]|nr:ATP-binding protein [Desulfoplanes sp.]
MEMKWNKHNAPRIFSPWVVIGSSLILFVIVAVLTVMNINRQRAATSQVLLEKGQAMIRALEAGSRIGMRGRFGQGIRLSHLLDETARLPGVEYIVVTDPQGKIIAHNEFSQIGAHYQPAAGAAMGVPGPQPQWFMEHGDHDRLLFVVYSEFRPMNARSKKHRNSMQEKFFMFCPANASPPEMLEGVKLPPKMYIYMGLGASSLEQARKSDLIHSLLMSFILLIVGLAGIVSLYWAQNVRVSQRLLSDSRAFASEVVANLPEGLIVITAGGEVSFMNESAMNIFTPEASPDKGGSGKDRIPSQVQPIVARLDTDNVVVEQEMVYDLSPDGEIPLGVSGARITTEDGRFVGKILIFRDLREVRRLQEEVKRKEKLAAIGSLAAGVAHEIRNPLSSIKGFATLFKTRFALESDEHEAAEIMIHEVDRLNRVVTELIEYARPSNITIRQSDVHELISHSLSLIRQDALMAGVQVETDIPGDIRQIFLDPDRMQQCLLNIYLNAIQSMPEGGILNIAVFRADKGRIGLRVTDTGKGIAEDDLPKIFDPYYTTKNRGTGLGLAMVLKIVEAHGGEIVVTSKEGEGTVFTLLLPDIG